MIAPKQPPRPQPTPPAPVAYQLWYTTRRLWKFAGHSSDYAVVRAQYEGQRRIFPRRRYVIWDTVVGAFHPDYVHPTIDDPGPRLDPPTEAST